MFFAPAWQARTGRRWEESTEVFAREVHLSSRPIERRRANSERFVSGAGIIIGGWSIKLEREMGSVNLLPI